MWTIFRWSLAWVSLAAPILLCGRVSGQSGAGDGDARNIGVTSPVLVHKVEPKYSEEGTAAHIQGHVVFQIVVDERGKATQITVLSPLGFGLDERAREAIEQWEFKPAMKDGKPVKVFATVNVGFAFPGKARDEKAEDRRTRYNLAIHSLDKDETQQAKATRAIEDLAGEGYPPAMYLMAVWLEEGKRVPRDLDKSLALMTQTAKENYGPALFEIGRRYCDGRGLPADPQKGLKTIHEAAELGSTLAQFDLGARYEAGDGVVQDDGRARRYFRLCAAAGQVACQFRLAQSILAVSARTDRGFVEAMAWLELASAKGFAPAVRFVAKEQPNLTPRQIAGIENLKTLLAPNP